LSVLTKALVVLVTVLSVLLVAVVVPFVANQEHYKNQADELQGTLTSARQSARVLQAELDKAQASRTQLIRDYEAQGQAQARQVNQLMQDLAQARGAEQAAAVAFEQAKADQTRLTATTQPVTRMLEATNQELMTRRNEMVSMELKLIEATDQINELSSQLDTLNVSVRRLREELAEREAQLRDYENRIARLPGDVRDLMLAAEPTADAYVPSVTIHGQVDKVDQIGAETFVQLNIGRRDQVAVNMKFVVYRGQQFLGTLVITMVDEDAAVGRMVLLQSPLQAGDAVRTGEL
jgi:chromosome segregation ATPase